MASRKRRAVAEPRAKQAGRGFYRVNTQWDEDGDDDFDQEIVIERILNQENVYFDPSAQKPDLTDAQWAMIVSWLTVEEFEERYPKAEVPLGDMAWKSWYADAPEWVNQELQAVLVAEYFYKVPARKTLERKDRNGKPVMRNGKPITRQKE